MKPKSLYDILWDAQSPDDIPRLKAIAARIDAGKVKYRNPIGQPATMPATVKESTLQSLKTHIDVLQGDYCPNHSLSVGEYWLQLHMAAPDDIPLHRIDIVEIKQSNIQRLNEFNELITNTIEEFITLNGYLPEVNNIINAWKHDPESGVSFIDDDVVIEGTAPRSLKNVKSTIKGRIKDQD